MIEIFGVDLYTATALSLSISALTQTNFQEFSSSDSNDENSAEKTQGGGYLKYQDPIIDRLINHKQNPHKINEGSRGVIYTRVSSIRDEEENNSLGDQEVKLEKVSSDENVEVPYETQKDGNHQ